MFFVGKVVRVTTGLLGKLPGKIIFCFLLFIFLFTVNIIFFLKDISLYLGTLSCYLFYDLFVCLFVCFLAKGIGCFRDTGRRAVATMEGKSHLLAGHYRRRRDAIRKCALAAERRGYRVFAIQHGGWCAASRTAYRTYSKYGRSNRCRNGKGGPWANDVYFLKGLSYRI